MTKTALEQVAPLGQIAFFSGSYKQVTPLAHSFPSGVYYAYRTKNKTNIFDNLMQ